MSEGEELEEAWAAPGSTALQAWLSLPLSSHYHPARLRPPWCSRPLPAVVPPGRTLGSKSGRWLRAAGHVVPSAPVVAQANNRGGGVFTPECVPWGSQHQATLNNALSHASVPRCWWGCLSLHVRLAGPRLTLGGCFNLPEAALPGPELICHTPSWLLEHLCPLRALGNASWSVSPSGITDPRMEAVREDSGRTHVGKHSHAAALPRRKEEGDLAAAYGLLPSRTWSWCPFYGGTKAPISPPTGFSARNSMGHRPLCGMPGPPVGGETRVNTARPAHRDSAGPGEPEAEWAGGQGVPEAREEGAPGEGPGGRRGGSPTTGSPGRRARSPAGSPAPGTRCAPRRARCTAACSCTSWRTSSRCPASARCTPGEQTERPRRRRHPHPRCPRHT